MRQIMNSQMKIGEIAIPDIELDLRSRDEIPKIFIGLQSIYCNKEVREQVFQVLMELIPKDVDTNRLYSALPCNAE